MSEQAMIDSKGAKARLMWAWFEAHQNQPMPEGRKEVEALFEVIEASARATTELERDQQERFKWAANERADAAARPAVPETLDVDAFLASFADRGELSQEWRDGIEYARLRYAAIDAPRRCEHGIPAAECRVVGCRG